MPFCIVEHSRFRVQPVSPLFSITSWKNDYNSFVFNNILVDRKVNISSPFVFNDLVSKNLNFSTPIYGSSGEFVGKA